MAKTGNVLMLGSDQLTLDKIGNFLNGTCDVCLSADAKKRIQKNRRFVESKLGEDKPYYGINTGFGLLANVRIPKDQLEKLQRNLVLSHASGVGEPLPPDVVKLMMLLRANVLAMGYSGVRPELIELLIQMIQKDIAPLVPSKGSVGASGDLAPLAHLALAMIGDGEVFYKGILMDAKQAFKLADLKPVKLMAKEGIALINGTQMMTACMSIALLKSFDLLTHADIAGALSVEGLRGSVAPFDEKIHKLRPHPGQIETAGIFRRLLKGSKIIASHKGCKRVQDPYSIRCIPQVHGAVRDCICFAASVIERELNSCTDNPLVFSDFSEILSGGNFHGEPVALAADLLAMVISELGSISERRIEQMTNPKSGELPVKFLTPNPGLNSGLATPHVVAASLVSENKTLSHPASVDSIPTFGGQEDHVSMGAWASRKVLNVIDNVEKIIAIEFLAAAQAIDLHEKKFSPSPLTSRVYRLIRKEVQFMGEDRFVGEDIEKMINLLKDGAILRTIGYDEFL